MIAFLEGFRFNPIEQVPTEEAAEAVDLGAKKGNKKAPKIIRKLKSSGKRLLIRMVTGLS